MPLQAQTRHVGGTPPPPRPPDPTLPPPEKRPWILITLGTSFNDDPAFFVAAAQAVDQLGCLPIVVLGQTEMSGLAPTWTSRLPPGAEIRNQVDFAEVLPYVAAAIHHGGAGTTHALITHAVPQLVVPHAADQMNQAQGVVRSGVGVHLPAKQVTVERLVATVAALLPDLSPYRSKAVALQMEFAALGGIPMAAKLIEMTLVEKGAPRESTG